MLESQNKFILESKIVCENEHKKNILSKNLDNYYKKWNTSKNIFADLDVAKKKVHYAKYKSIENLEKNIVDFDKNLTELGGKVLYAPSKKEALSYILQILNDNDINKVIKSKSTVCEEIGLDDFLISNKISTLETNLGDFLVQLVGQKSAHIVTSAVHMSKSEIVGFLNEKYDQEFSDNTSHEILVRFIRNLLREEFLKAGAGITGANFLIADQGSIAITENEANAILSATSSKVHIVVAGIEKILPSADNLELFQTLLASHATGQNITTYNHLFSGIQKQTENPRQIYVILLDNGRTSLMKDVMLREASYCIKCGACYNFCPVFKQIGGHAYGTVYGGPIGSVISPYIFGIKNFSHLPYASTLCGKCNDVCPVRIDLTSLLIQERKNIVSNSINNLSERRAFKMLSKVLLKRKRMERRPAFLKNISITLTLRKNWSQQREVPKFAKQSFNKIKKINKN